MSGRPDRRFLVAGVLGALGAVLAVLFVVAPVEQDVATYRWDLDDGVVASAVPLSTYRPDALTVTVGPAQTAAVGDGRAVVATRPTSEAGPDPDALWIGRTADATAVVLAGRTLWTGAVPAGLEVAIDAAGTVVRTGSDVLAEQPGGRRPQVSGFFSDLPRGASTAGLSGSVVADTRFESTPTPLKVGLGVGAALCVAGSLAAVATRRRVRLLRRRRPSPADAVVLGGLAVWAVIGPTSVDDGYTTTMVADAARSGYVGGYHHWLNSPEAPFGSFYEVFRLWSLVSTELLWLRLPSILLGALAWLLLSRAVLPRLIPGARTDRGVALLAAAVYLAAWLPFCVGLRSEPWIVVGSLLTWCCVERGLATRRLLPVALGVLVAALTVSVAPTGLVAAAVLVVSAGPVLRMLRGRLLPAAGVLAGCGLLVLVVMFGDQTPAAVQAGTQVRALIGPNFPWDQELGRYRTLFLSPDTEGSFGRRVPVLTMLLGLVVLAALALRRRRIPGVHAAAARRLAGATALGLASLALAPTKWTHHFGAFAGFGTAVVVLLAWAGVHAVRSPARRAVLAAAVALAGALALTGAVTWWLASAQGVTWGFVPPSVAGVPMSTLALLVAAVWGVVAVAVPARPGLVRLVPSTVVVLGVLAVGTVGLQTYGLVRAVTTTDGYSVGGDTLASLAGGRCGLAAHLRVEPSPAAGLLASSTDAVTTGGMRPGAAVPAYASPYDVPATRQWQATAPGRLTTGWYPLPEQARDGSVPLVVTAGGAGSAALVAEFGPGDATVAVGTPATPADTRITVPVGAREVRLTARVDDGWVGLSAPRVPRLVPFADAYPADAPAVLDWPIAPLLPCQRLATLAGGVAELPALVVTPGIPEAEATRRDAGGPFASVTDLADLEPVPTYVDGAPGTWSAQVYAVQPRLPLRAPLLDRATTIRSGWARGPDLYSSTP